MSTALIFDCDGVLADTERDCHLPAFNRAFRDLNIPLQWSEAEYGELLRIGGGKERLRTIPDSHPEAGLPTDPAALDAIIADLHALKTRHYIDIVQAGVPGRPGVRRLIASALADGRQVAVASTSAEASVRAVLIAAVGEEDAARIPIFAGDIVPAKKPAPDIYLHALQTLKLNNDDVVVVEDSQAGAAAAAAAGLAHIITVSTYTADDDFPAASLVITDLGEPDAPADLLTNADQVPFDGAVTLATIDAVAAHHR